MLRVRAGYEDAGRYALTCLRIADQTVLHASNWDLRLEVPAVATDLRLPETVVAEALDFDYRFTQQPDGTFRLLLHDRLSPEARTPILTVIHDILYWRGLPMTARALHIEAAQCMETPPTPETIARVMSARPQFTLCDDKWLLSEWLGDGCQFEPGFALLEPSTDGAPSRPCSKDPLFTAVQLLEQVTAPVPFSRLHWATRQICSAAVAGLQPRQFAALVLNCGQVVVLRNGQVTLETALTTSSDRIRGLRPAQLQSVHEELLRRTFDHQSDGDAIGSVLSTLKRDATRMVVRHLQQHSTEVISLPELLEHTPVKEQIIERIRVIGETELNEDEVQALALRMRSEVTAEVRAALRREGAIFLPADRVALIDQGRARALALALRDVITGVKTETLLHKLWPGGIPEDIEGPALATHMEKFDVECTQGFWHAGTAVLAEIASSTARSVREWLSATAAPAPLAGLVAMAIPVDPGCPQPVLQVVREVVGTMFGRRRGFWLLKCGLWWARPDRLVTEDRIRELVAAAVADEEMEHALEGVLGLDLHELTSEERAKLVRAFLSRMPARPTEDGEQSSEAGQSHVPDVFTPTEPAAEIPRSSYVTLTAEMMRARSLTLPPKARKILVTGCSDVLSDSPLIAFTVEGRFRIQARLVDQGAHLESVLLFVWLADQGAQSGDRVVFYAPTPPDVLPHVALERERQSPFEGEHGQRLAQYLRERIFAVLQECGSAMRIDDIVGEVNVAMPSPARRSSIEAALSANSHLFAAWGRAIWGLRAWAEDWSDHVDLQLLLWRIEDEDLTVSILKGAGRPVSEQELAREIADYFSIRVELVRQVTFLRRDDPRLVFDPVSGLIRLASDMRRDTASASFLRPYVEYMNRNPAPRRRIRSWFRVQSGKSLDGVLSDYGLVLQS